MRQPGCNYWCSRTQEAFLQFCRRFETRQKDRIGCKGLTWTQTRTSCLVPHIYDTYSPHHRFSVTPKSTPCLLLSIGIHFKQVEQPHVPGACKGNSLEDEDQSGQQIFEYFLRARHCGKQF